MGTGGDIGGTVKVQPDEQDLIKGQYYTNSDENGFETDSDKITFEFGTPYFSVSCEKDEFGRTDSTIGISLYGATIEYDWSSNGSKSVFIGYERGFSGAFLLGVEGSVRAGVRIPLKQ